MSIQNEQLGASMTKQVSKLTKEMRAAINHWEAINKPRSQMKWASKLEGGVQTPVLQQNDGLDRSPHVANLIWKDFSSNAVTIRRSLLNSLSFHTMEFRHSEIRNAHQQTFNWAFERVFQAWLSSPQPIFWISGKPGSGKSTLMKFLADNPKTPTMLERWSGTRRLVISSYFFWINGTKLQRSQEGLLRALLHEILNQCPDVIEEVLPDQSEAMRIAIVNRRQTELQWSRDTLLSAFKRLLEHRNAIETKFCMFIDGLDEYNANSKHSFDDLIQTIRCLTELDVKICVASRPWNEFEDAYGKNLKCKL